MDIRIHLADTELRGTLADTPAARDFAGLLPLTLTLTDFHATEKVADLPRRLDTSGAPAGTSATAGDITYYAPWGNLAIFYRDFRHSPGLVRLGSLEPAAVTTLRSHNGPFTATIDIPEDDS